MLDQRTITFLAVCETMSFTRAAEQLHITQPAVSQQIHALESEYGCRLIQCKGRKLRLTEEGELLRQGAAAMRSDENLLLERIRGSGSRELPLHFGVTKTIGEFVIAAPLAAYLKAHPKAAVQMEIGNTGDLTDRLQNGGISFALVEGCFDRNEFDSETFASVPFIPVCAAGHRFRCGKKPEVLKDLTGETLLLRERGSGTRDILEKQLAAAGLSPECFDRTVEIGGMHTILGMLEADAGISFMYRSAAEEGIRAGKLSDILLNDLRLHHDFSLIWEKGSANAAAYRQACRELRQPVKAPEKEPVRIPGSAFTKARAKTVDRTSGKESK